MASQESRASGLLLSLLQARKVPNSCSVTDPYPTGTDHQYCASRFFSDGQFVYRTSPDVVRNAAKSLQLSPGKSKADSQVERGLWRLNVSVRETQALLERRFGSADLCAQLQCGRCL